MTHHNHVEVDRVMKAGKQLYGLQVSRGLHERLLFFHHIANVYLAQQRLLDHLDSHMASGDVVFCFKHRSCCSRAKVFDDGELVNADIELSRG